MKFTDEQKDVIQAVEGNVCSIASAGSGKTSAFVTRIGLMIKKRGISPNSIMSITFTKKSANEMTERLSKLIGKRKAQEVVMGTTHSIFYKLLREHIVGYKNYEILPSWKRYTILKDIIEPHEPQKNPNGVGLGVEVSTLGAFFSYQKSLGVSTYESIVIDDNIGDLKYTPKEKLMTAFKNYENMKKNGNNIDFDDILLHTYLKLKNNVEFRNCLQEQFQYIMIDEFQDSSKIVIDIVKLINDKNVFVVGDFRQSIYSFINARVENILNFANTFKDTKVVELNKNFRSTQNIVNFSNDIISKSTNVKFRDYKESEPSSDELGEEVVLTAYQDDFRQAKTVCQNINDMINDGVNPSEIAILYRSNSDSMYYESELSRLEIPYIVTASYSFYDRHEIIDMLAFLEISQSKMNSDSAISRIYNKPNRFISKRVFGDIEGVARKENVSVYEAIGIYQSKSSGMTASNLQKLRTTIKDIHALSDRSLSAYETLDKILKITRYVQDELEKREGNEDKVDSIEKLLELSHKFPTVGSLLTYIAKAKERKKKAQEGTQAVNLSTIHSSKGLEWDNVYVVGAINGSIPHKNSASNIEEELRLFYVACSRPRKRLFISWESTGYNDNKSGMEKKIPSMFIQLLIGKERALEMCKEVFATPYISYDYSYLKQDNVSYNDITTKR